MKLRIKLTWNRVFMMGLLNIALCAWNAGLIVAKLCNHIGNPVGKIILLVFQLSVLIFQIWVTYKFNKKGGEL